MKVRIEDGDDWVRVFVGKTCVLDDHGHANHWKDAFIGALQMMGYEVEESYGRFDVDESGDQVFVPE
jgi:hypothetical protein